MKSQILILEDDTSLLKLYTTGLTYAGYMPVGVDNMQDLQRQLEQGKTDLIISDLHIGRTSGELMINILGQIQQQRQIPVIAISGNISRYKSECETLGLRCLQKPFTNEVLVSLIEDILDEQQGERSG